MGKSKYRDAILASTIAQKPVSGGLGESLLKKFGWKEGEGLGAEKKGTVEPLQMRRRAENLGVSGILLRLDVILYVQIGAEKAKAKEWNTWWEDVYNQGVGKTQPVITASEPAASESSSSSSEEEMEEKGEKSVLSMTGEELVALCWRSD